MKLLGSLLILALSPFAPTWAGGTVGGDGDGGDPCLDLEDPTSSPNLLLSGEEETCLVTSTDYLDPKCGGFTLLVLMVWLVPVLAVVIPNKPRSVSKAIPILWHFAVSVPALVFEVWTSLAAILAGLRCKQEEEEHSEDYYHDSGCYSLLISSGAVGLWLWVMEIFLWTAAAYFGILHRKIPNRPDHTTRSSSSTNAADHVVLSERLWELNEPIMTSPWGTALILFFGVIVFAIMTAPMLLATQFWQDHDASAEVHESGDDGNDETSSSIRMECVSALVLLHFAILSVVLCVWPHVFVQRVRDCCTRTEWPELDDNDDNNNEEEEDEHNDSSSSSPVMDEVAKFRYLTMRHVLANASVLMVSLVNSNWVVGLVFAVDGSRELAIFLGVHYWKQQRNNNGDNDDEWEWDDNNDDDDDTNTLQMTKCSGKTDDLSSSTTSCDGAPKHPPGDDDSSSLSISHPSCGRGINNVRGGASDPPVISLP